MNFFAFGITSNSNCCRLCQRSVIIWKLFAFWKFDRWKNKFKIQNSKFKTKTFSHPTDSISIGNGRTRISWTVVSGPTNEHNTGALNSTSRSKLIMILSRINFDCFCSMINFTLIQFVNIITLNEIRWINCIRTSNIDFVIRRNACRTREKAVRIE